MEIFRFAIESTFPMRRPQEIVRNSKSDGYHDIIALDNGVYKSGLRNYLHSSRTHRQWPGYDGGGCHLKCSPP